MNLKNNINKSLYTIVITILYVLIIPGLVQAQEKSWPRELKLESGVLTIYQPQIDELEQDILHFRAAVSYKATGSSEPAFGAAWF